MTELYDPDTLASAEAALGPEDADEIPWRCAATPGGYAWWYVDVSDGEHALTAILFAGAVFSPDYAARVRAGAGDRGLDHPAVHVSLLTGARPLAWAMNEYPPAALARRDGGIVVAGSRLERLPDGGLRVTLAEPATRFFARPGPPIEGEIRLGPGAGPLPPRRLSPPGGEAHHWRPLRVGGQAEVDLQAGGRRLRFTGAAYHDSNFGAGRLEQTFSSWCWAHGAAAASGAAAVLYQVRWRAGGGCGLLLRSGAAGMRLGAAAPDAGAPVRAGLLWLPAPARFSVGELRCERLPGPLLDAPFYARYRARITDGSTLYRGVGEYLDLDRFRSRGVQFLLRYRTRRAEP